MRTFLEKGLRDLLAIKRQRHHKVREFLAFLACIFGLDLERPVGYLNSCIAPWKNAGTNSTRRKRRAGKGTTMKRAVCWKAGIEYDTNCREERSKASNFARLA